LFLAIKRYPTGDKTEPVDVTGNKDYKHGGSMMNQPCAPHMLYISYWEFFKQYYKPQIQELDMLLKSIDSPISASEAATVLVMKSEEIEEIMTQEKISLIDKDNFLNIMMHGSSPLCRLLQRECSCGSPDRYSPKHIAYIYGLQDNHVAEICQANGYTDVPAHKLPDLLNKIYVFIMQ